MRDLHRFLASIGLSLTIAVVPFPARTDPLLTYPLKIRGHVIRVEIAADDYTRRIGLMHRRQLPENGGMLFVYDTEERSAMWMKNTYIPLSVAFIDRDGRIINIEDMEPLTDEAHGSLAPAKYALEANQGWFRKRGIGPGDTVQGLSRIPGLK